MVSFHQVVWHVILSGWTWLLQEVPKSMAKWSLMHFSSDGEDMSAPNGVGAELMRKVLERANIKAEEVDYINAHATATPWHAWCNNW